MEKASATTKGEKVIAEERRKAREAEAKMNLHEDKARHKAKREDAGHAHAAHATHATQAAYPADGRAALLASHGQHGGHLPASTTPPGEPAYTHLL